MTIPEVRIQLLEKGFFIHMKTPTRHEKFNVRTFNDLVEQLYAFFKEQHDLVYEVRGSASMAKEVREQVIENLDEALEKLNTGSKKIRTKQK